jgi:hypothetical protein
MGVIYETSIFAFLFVTVLAGGGAAFMIGRAGAKRWKPFPQSIPYILLLGCVVRFLHWGLFAGAALESWRQAQGSLLSAHYFLVDALVLLVFAGLGYRLQRASQMAQQYGWIVTRTGPFTWRMLDSATLRPQSGAKGSVGSL